MDEGVSRIDIAVAHAVCPVCGADCKRHSRKRRNFYQLGKKSASVKVEMFYSIFYCSVCVRHFPQDVRRFVLPGMKYSRQIFDKAVALLNRGISLILAAEMMRAEYGVDIPHTTLHDWKNLERKIDEDF